jgi:hypothetical protein
MHKYAIPPTPATQLSHSSYKDRRPWSLQATHGRRRLDNPDGFVAIEIARRLLMRATWHFVAVA